MVIMFWTQVFPPHFDNQENYQTEWADLLKSYTFYQKISQGSVLQQN